MITTTESKNVFYDWQFMCYLIGKCCIDNNELMQNDRKRKAAVVPQSSSFQVGTKRKPLVSIENSNDSDREKSPVRWQGVKPVWPEWWDRSLMVRKYCENFITIFRDKRIMTVRNTFLVFYSQLAILKKIFFSFAG